MRFDFIPSMRCRAQGASGGPAGRAKALRCLMPRYRGVTRALDPVAHAWGVFVA